MCAGAGTAGASVVMNFRTFRVIKVLSPKLLGITRDGDSALWDQARLRLPKICAGCDQALKPGDQAFSPMGNTSYRYERLCLQCVAELINANTTANRRSEP
jgi:hypothetical protein